jgi:hypothetical protein
VSLDFAAPIVWTGDLVRKVVLEMRTLPALLAEENAGKHGEIAKYLARSVPYEQLQLPFLEAVTEQLGARGVTLCWRNDGYVSYGEPLALRDTEPREWKVLEAKDDREASRYQVKSSCDGMRTRYAVPLDCGPVEVADLVVDLPRAAVNVRRLAAVVTANFRELAVVLPAERLRFEAAGVIDVRTVGWRGELSSPA